MNLRPLLALALAATLHAEPAATTPPPAAPAPAPSAAPAPSPLTHPAQLRENASYSLGMAIAADMQSQGLNILPDEFAAGFKDHFTGATPRFSADERKAILAAFEQQLAAEAAAAGERATKEGSAFLSANMTKPGVKMTASGLQYRIITPGTGPHPKPTDTVNVHYQGKFVDGKVFDSSYARGEPATLPINMALKGWAEALPMMQVGAKWEIFLPSPLAYGEKGNGREIPPNTALIFEVELLSIKN